MAATAAYNSQFLITSTPSVSFTDEAMTDSGDHTTYTITNSAKRYLDKNTAVVVQTSPDGVTWTTITSGFTLYYVNARVVFNSAQSSTTQVRLHSGAYFAYAALGNAHLAEFAAKLDTADVTTFNTTGTKSFLPTLMAGTLKCSQWWLNTTRLASLQARDLIVVSFVSPTGARYEGFAYASDCNLKADVKAALDEDLVFQLTDQFFAS